MKPSRYHLARLSFPLAAAIAALLSTSHAQTNWDGGGGGTTSIDLNTNWNNDSVSPLDGSTPATFGTGGSTATINTDASFTGITINRDSNFTIANGAGSLTLGTGGITVNLPSLNGRSHTISESNLILGDSQTWAINNNGAAYATLTVSSAISELSESNLFKSGGGTLILSGTQFTTSFTGWTFNGGAYSRRKSSATDLPGVTGETASENQVVELNNDGTFGEINIAHNWAATDTYYLRVEASPMSWSGNLQRYIRQELREQDGTLLWQAPQDATTAVPLYNSYMSSLTDYPSELTFFFQIDASAFSGAGVTEGSRLR